MLSEWFQGQKISVAAPFFNQVNWPLGLGLLILTGICPLIAWRKATWRNFRRNLLIPSAGGVLAGVALYPLGVTKLVPLLFFSAAAFVVVTAVLEYFKGARARQSREKHPFMYSSIPWCNSSGWVL